MPDFPWLRRGFDHIWLPYAQMKNMKLPLPVVGAQGARLKLADGRELVDGVSSWWTACHGYNHPHITRIVSHQLAQFPHVMLGGLANEQAYRLAARLADLTPGDLSRVFFSESGSVSVEIAMKIALQYWINRGVKGRYRFLSFRNGYHGDTLGAMSVCDPEEGMHKIFSGHVPQQLLADLPEEERAKEAFIDLLNRHKDELAAIIIEPLVQGAGGMKFHSASTLAFVAQAAKAKNILWIADEIMTGFGRLGSLFACEEAAVVPDIMTLSKALTGGTLPLAATLVRGEIFEAFQSDSWETILMHGPTYAGNALACAAANASLDLFASEPRLDQVKKIDQILAQTLSPLKGLKGVKDVRIKGALGIVQLERAGEGEWLRPLFIERGVWVRPFGDIVYVAPPFIISEKELRLLTDAISDVVTFWSVERA